MFEVVGVFQHGSCKEKSIMVRLQNVFYIQIIQMRDTGEIVLILWKRIVFL